jgi:CRISPR/Cas system-associated protein Cas5 (RAMP superfamily)
VEQIVVGSKFVNKSIRIGLENNIKISRTFQYFKTGLGNKKFFFLLSFLILQSCIITTHSVNQIKTSELNPPEDKSEITSFKFSSAVRVQKTKDWFRNYFGLEADEYLVNFKTSFLESSAHQFIVAVFDYSDREEYLDLTGILTGRGVESREASIRFFVGTTVTDKTGVDHLAENAVFQKPLLEELTEMRKEFKTFTVENPDQKFFYGR